MHSSVVVIADDLTGAADAGVAFLSPRTPVAIVLEPGAAGRRSGSTDVQVIDTDTREVDAATASRTVASVAQGLRLDQLVLKKVDSMLRGNVAAELGALRHAMPGHQVIFAPAFPQAGRVTLDGVQHMHGAPVATDVPPPASSGLRNLLHPFACRTVGLAEVRSGALPEVLSTATEGEIAVCDALTDADLDHIVAAGLGCGHPVLWAGSGGLAAALARHARPDTHHVRPALTSCALTSCASDGHYLAVIGSMSAVAQRQADALVRAGAHRVAVPVSTLAGGTAAELVSFRQSVTSASQQGDLVVTVDGDTQPSSSDAVRRALAGIVAEAAEKAALLVLTGGATSRAVLTEMRVSAIDLEAQLAPGVVLATAPALASAAIVIKPGAFGDDRTLLNAVLHTLPRGET
jgi:4-hydroxythreonine-4-phosphate dehydrogenase